MLIIMQRKISNKGFTLIELLAVILILGIIALIAVPAIGDIIDSASKKAFIQTGNSIADLTERECNTSMLTSKDTNIVHYFDEDRKEEIDLKGKMPTSGGAIITDDNCSVSLNINNGKYCAVKSPNSDRVIGGRYIDGMCITEETKTSSCSNQDSNPGAFKGTGIVNDPYLVESIEDLYAIKLMTSAATKNKYFKLMVDLDFKNDCSYANPSNITFGDINKSNKVSGMKQEVNEGQGFTYSGNEPQIFSGNFDGNNKAIKNLYMNGNSANAYAGLFERVQNTTDQIYFKNIILENVNISNIEQYVGGIIGNIAANTKVLVDNINVTGNINAKTKAGGIIGDSASIGGSTFNNILFNGTVKCTKLNCGGVLGNQSNTIVTGGEPISMSSVKSISNIVAEGDSGIVIGSAYGIELDKIYSYGKLSNIGLSDSWQGWMGGIAGELILDKNYMLQNLYNHAYFELDRTIGFVGGLFGELDFNSSVSISERAKLIKAYNYGDINLISTWGDDGGLVGEANYVDCYDCYNHGDILNDRTQGSVIGGIFGGSNNAKCTNCGNYGEINGYENVYGINGGTVSVTVDGMTSNYPGEIYNSVNYGTINCTNYCYAMNGTVNNSYSVGDLNINNYGSVFTGIIENSYAKEKVYADGPSNLNTTFAASGLGGKNVTNSVFIGSLTKNDAHDRSLTDPSWTNSIDLMTTSSEGYYTFNNVYYSKIGGNVSSTKGIAVPFDNITTLWFKDTLKLGDNFLYEEGYYPRVYKLDINGNPTIELVEGQPRVSIR